MQLFEVAGAESGLRLKITTFTGPFDACKRAAWSLLRACEITFTTITVVHQGQRPGQGGVGQRQRQGGRSERLRRIHDVMREWVDGEAHASDAASAAVHDLKKRLIGRRHLRFS
jgi:hypothetical protein